MKNKGILAELGHGILLLPLRNGFKTIICLASLAFLCMNTVAQENTAEGWFKDGQALERIGSWEKALEAFNKAIELHGEGQNSTFGDGIQACNKAVEFDPGNARSWSGKGFVLSQMALVADDQRKYNESLQAYDKAIEVANKNKTMLAEAWYGKGDVLIRMGKDDEALQAYENAIDLNQSCAIAWVGKAFALSRLKRYDEALMAYDRAFELYTSEDQRLYDYPYLWYDKGRALEKLGREKEASQAYNKSVEDADKIIALVESGGKFYMNLSQAWQGKGELLGELGGYCEALEALNSATRIAPGYALAWKAKGEILSYGLVRYEESLEAYDQALRLDPAGSGAWTDKGNALRSLGRNREAVQAYDHALDIDPSMVAALSGKGAALRGLGKNNESAVAYDEAIKAIEPGSRSSSASLDAADAWLGMAESLADADRAVEASEAYVQSILAYEKSIQINPESAKAWTGKGDALLSLKRYNESMQSYEKALEILNRSIEGNPKDAEAWWLKAECLESLGRSEAALGAYDKVTDLKGAKALGTRIRKADLLAELGRVNDSMEAFDGVLEILPTEDKDSSFTELWDERTDIYYAAWLADGQILRTCLAWFNRSCGDFENVLLVSSDLVAAWQRPDPNRVIPSPGKHAESIANRSANLESIWLPRCCGDACKR
jgi:tetratricopeptide (TPR) repeat protein